MKWRRALELIWFRELFIAIVPLSILLIASVSLGLNVLFIIEFGVVVVGALVCLQWWIHHPQHATGAWMALSNVGLLCIVGWMGGAGWIVLMRAPDSVLTRVSSFIWPFVLIAMVICLGLSNSPNAVIAKALVAIAVTPFLAAWLLVSTTHLGWEFLANDHLPYAGADAKLKSVRDQRVQSRQEWATRDGSIVAVTLSGGGYRAAVTHAGLLWALDEAGISIDYLSTVSGGSITGAAYAAGWKPEELRNVWRAQRPGLAEDYLNAFNFLPQLLSTSSGTGDVFAAHLRRMYFGSRGLDQTGPPTLIVNTTNLNTGAREAFWPGKGRDIELARAVAASAAFPVVMDPLRIETALHVDGGVFENLGLEGLLAFSQLQFSRESQTYVPFPRVLIVSNLTAVASVPPHTPKPSPVDVGMRIQDVIYDRMHGLYIEKKLDNHGQDSAGPFKVKAKKFWFLDSEEEMEVIVLNPRARDVAARIQKECGKDSCSAADRTQANDLRERILSIQALVELSAEEVDAAFWLGAAMGRAYRAEICSLVGGLCKSIKMPKMPESVAPRNG